MHVQLTGSFCNIEIILEEPIDRSESLFVKSFGYVGTEDFFQKIFTKRDRELIDQSSDSQFIIGEYGLFRVKKFSDF